MAERRMFAKSIVLSGRFMKLPPTTQLLYYQLCMQADDDGFHDSPDFTMRNCRATQQDMGRLEEQGYIHLFDSDVAVILHWQIHNQIRRDRRKPTRYTAEASQLYVGGNGEYRLTAGQQTADSLAAQDRIGKDSLGQDSSGQEIPPVTQPGDRSAGAEAPRLAEVMCYSLEHQIQTNVLDFYNYYLDLGWPGESRHTWRTLLKRWEEENAGTP